MLKRFIWLAVILQIAVVILAVVFIKGCNNKTDKDLKVYYSEQGRTW